ncbi:MAG: hypothetical protein WCT32_02155 [Patescibacteria group bacterium]
MKQKTLALLMLLTLLFSPVLVRAETSTPAFDLEVMDVDYDTATGHPNKVLIKNVSPTNFTGRIYLIVEPVSASGGRLHESVGALDYGMSVYYQDVFTDITIGANQTYWSPISKGVRFRHREMAKVKVELRADNDSNRANNTKLFDAPSPDLYATGAYAKKQDTSPYSWADQYVVYYKIVNGGLVGYVGGNSISEPNHNIKVKYEDGSESYFGSDFSYSFFENIGPAGVLTKERLITVDNRKTAKDLIITIDQENRIAEGNESNNVLTQSLSIAALPDSSALLASGHQAVIDEFQDDVKKLGLGDKSKLLGLEVKPCSTLSGLKDFKDNISAGLTFNKEKKTTKKIKQAAQKVQVMKESKDELAKDKECLDESLSDYKDAQIDITKNLSKLNKSDKEQGEKLSTLALTSGLTEMKVVNLIATASTAAEIKGKSEAVNKEVVSTLVENSKMVTDKTALKTVLSDSFEAGDSTQMALLNLDILNGFKEVLDGFSAFLVELEKENALDLKLELAELGQAQIDEMNELMEDLSFQTDAESTDGQSANEGDTDLVDLFEIYDQEEDELSAETVADESGATDPESSDSSSVLEGNDAMSSGNETKEAESSAASAQFEEENPGGEVPDSDSTGGEDSAADAPTDAPESSDDN